MRNDAIRSRWYRVAFNSKLVIKQHTSPIRTRLIFFQCACIFRMKTQLEDSRGNESRLLSDLLLATDDGEAGVLENDIKEILLVELSKIFSCVNHRPVTILLYDPQHTNKLCFCRWTRRFIATQVRAVMEATIAAAKVGTNVLPRILIPCSANESDILIVTEIVHATAHTLLNTIDFSKSLPNFLPRYEVGVVLSNPRACFRARKIVSGSSATTDMLHFVVFDTDSLTRLMWGYRNDGNEAGKIKCHMQANKRDEMIRPLHSIDEDVSKSFHTIYF